VIINGTQAGDEVTEEGRPPLTCQMGILWATRFTGTDLSEIKSCISDLLEFAA